MESLMDDLDLTAYRHAEVSTLSNGLRRRLSILLAFVGSTQVSV